MEARREIRISGIVQGVGFRPYVFRLATELKLSGTISNTAVGVTIEIQGPDERVQDFVSRLPRCAPALARITEVAVRELPCDGAQGFRILASREGDPLRTLISPDVATCEDCLRELFDPADRRYLYPFINCTNCGPRFTIVRGMPYDRCRTSMAEFEMCSVCRAEYEDPGNRRFHAQPNGCWDCGPQLQLWDASGQRIETPDPVHEAARRIRIGEIVAVKGIGGFHLAADASNPQPVQNLRQRKHRAEKPFALMTPNLETASTFCVADDLARTALLSRERPIVLLPKQKDAVIADAVAPRHGEFGVFLPYSPLHHLLFAAGEFTALLMTSGNLSDEPIAIENREAASRLAGIADCFLVHNREILLRCDDSVVRPRSGGIQRLRRSRGYVPAPLTLGFESAPVLAVGGELNNTICLARGRDAFLSQHIGDLENAESFSFFRETVGHLSRILEVEPAIVAHDLHPDYLSTKWALAQQSMEPIAVQHHHAHIASCMAENRLEGKVIGLALDGTGYGTDRAIWGGEALLADYHAFERVAHFAYVPMPGGAAAIREPWRMAVSYLTQAFGPAFLDWDLPFVGALDRGKTETVLRMITRAVNSPLTSSCGRLFDGIAALIGVRERITYQAQAAIELEMLGWNSDDQGAYPFDLHQVDGNWEIGTAALFEAVVKDLARNTGLEIISRRFHNGLVAVCARLAGLLREKSLLNRVCLSGGVFHNKLVLDSLVGSLRSAEFEVFTQSQVPTGDGGLSLGQAVIAASRVPAT